MVTNLKSKKKEKFYLLCAKRNAGGEKFAEEVQGWVYEFTATNGETLKLGFDKHRDQSLPWNVTEITTGMCCQTNDTRKCRTLKETADYFCNNQSFIDELVELAKKQEKMAILLSDLIAAGKIEKTS
jgi:hypothetical protein